ncbi:MAG: alpha-amylase family glycosyl hydrolase [Clostridiaceae bacterium]|nr:alpha-amylase family glycosyl hydrolase [Clostridiaceae bacterium]
MKKRLYVIVTVIIVLLFGSLGIFYQVYSKSKPVQIVFHDSVINEDFKMLNFCISDKNSKAYGTYEKDDGTDFKLYELKKDGGEYKEPKEITLPNDMKCMTINLSQDEDKAYMTIIKKDPSNKEGQKKCIAYTSLDDFEDLKCDDITFIDELNSIDDTRFCSIDKNGDILYITNNDGDFELKLAENKDGGYITQTINTRGFYCQGAALTPDGDNIIISLPYDGSNQSVYNLFSIKKLDDAWDTPKLLQTLNDGSEDKIFPVISSDGKDVYYLSSTPYTLFDSENIKIRYSGFKSELSKVLDNAKKENEEAYTKKNEATHKYDTANFDLKLRNKSDMSKKKGVYYELYVNAFADSDGDGYGDLNGVTENLDYLKDLGIDGIWLMPINASLSYHGYDVTDYYAINKRYGTEEDFKKLLDEAHKRDIKIIMDLVVNHTSSLNPWFTQACIDKDSKYRDYYRWVSPEDSENMNKDDKSPWNSDVWSKDGDSYYYSIFYSGMPDLNYNNKEVRKEVKNIAKKYLELGVDGFRLDGAMHIYGNNEFKKQEDRKLDCNIQWWNEFASACEEINPSVYLVGEIWNDNDVFPEYAQPMDSKFNFTFRNEMFNAVKKGTAVLDANGNLSDKLQKILDQYKQYDSNYIDAVFAGNHDLDRTMSIIDNEDKAKLIANIYLTLPGNPYLYYGEEIGMKGSGKDEFKRMPFKWNEDNSLPQTNWYKKVSGMTEMTVSSTPSFEKQKDDSNSMYSHYKNLLQLRKSNNPLNDGTYESFKVNSNDVMAYKREANGETVYVLHNLSRNPVTLNISEVSEGEVIFKSNDNDTLGDGKISLDKTSSIMIKVK